MTRAWPRILIGLLALAAAAGTARLGLWQLDRARTKLLTQQAIDERERQPPLAAHELATQAQQRDTQRHRRILVSGRWAVQHTVFLDNRAHEGRAGFIVLTPLVLPDGSAVLVERGWVPRDFRDRMRLPQLPQDPGDMSVLGRITDAPTRVFELEASASGRIRQNVDPVAFARETGLRLRPVALRQLDARDDGLIRDWPRPDLGRHKNLGYAFQWFALSALVITLYVWFQVIRPWRRRRAP